MMLGIGCSLPGTYCVGDFAVEMAAGIVPISTKNFGFTDLLFQKIPLFFRILNLKALILIQIS